jgi:hypothetical protein
MLPNVVKLWEAMAAGTVAQLVCRFGRVEKYAMLRFHLSPRATVQRAIYSRRMMSAKRNFTAPDFGMQFALR